MFVHAVNNHPHRAVELDLDATSFTVASGIVTVYCICTSTDTGGDPAVVVVEEEEATAIHGRLCLELPPASVSIIVIAWEIPRTS